MTTDTRGSGESDEEGTPPRETDEREIRVAIVTNILAPYRVPLFNAIASNSDIELRVLTTTDRQRNRDWEGTDVGLSFEHRVLSGVSRHSYLLDRSVGVNPTVVPSLRGFDPDVIVVGGYSDITTWIALAYSKLSGAALVPWIGSWKESARLSSHPITSLKRRFIRSGDAWIAYGSRAANYICGLGGDSSKIFEATNTVDLDWFYRKSRETSTPPEGKTRLQLLYCGQLIPRKNVEFVIDVLADLPNVPINCTIVGDGPKYEALEGVAADMESNVRFVGHLDREILPQYYGSADVLILPSHREVWGLVVNEALACGTAALVSTKCGCAPDLIDPGFNGETFDPDVSGELRDILQWASRERTSLRERRSAIAEDVMERASIATSAAAFSRAIREAYTDSK